MGELFWCDVTVYLVLIGSLEVPKPPTPVSLPPSLIMGNDNSTSYTYNICKSFIPIGFLFF